MEERIEVFKEMFMRPHSPFLTELEKEALSDRVPIIRKDTQSFLRFLLNLRKPERILEIGTAVGFSAIMMAENTEESCIIDTIENYEKRIPVAAENIKKSGYEKRITLFEGDAAEVLKTLKEPYDFIFMDAAKGQYPVFFNNMEHLIKKGTVIVTDNIFQDGDMIESKYAVRRRDRTIHKRMRDYLYDISQKKDYETDILPIGDGLSLMVKK
ncbi:MAG: O-methyltransferase [Lachnospiraceae bacterium]|nr:O-methyltransferase [Lachnospiraceae bacterium]